MKYLKANSNLIFGILLLIISILNVLIYKSEYIYKPKSYALFLVICIAVLVVFVVFSTKNKSNVNKKCKVFGILMPVLMLINMISLLFGFDFRIDCKTYSLAYYELLFGASIAASIILFFVYNPVKWLRACGIICTSLFTVVFGFVLFITLDFTGFGEISIVQTKNSPDNIYSVRVVSSDQGASGGHTYVYTRNISNDINLLLGRLITQEKPLWSGGVNDNPILEWTDNNNILINNISYNIEYILRSKYFDYRGYYSTLNVFVPQREPDYVNDTHGGFLGDGDTFEKFILSEEEVMLIQKDIENNPLWHKITSENRQILYGGEEEWFSEGLLQGKIPNADNGYYCVYNKQKNEHEFPDEGDPSHNYIICIYSADENIFYIYEDDT